MVYAVFNTHNGFVYIGQTTRNVVTKFWEHIQSALHYEFVLHKGEGGEDEKDAAELYAAMQRMGAEHFVIIHIEVTTPERLNGRQPIWIRRMGTKVYNIRHAIRPPRRSSRFHWRLLKRANASEDVPRITEVKSVANQVIQSRKLCMSPLYLFDLLTQASCSCGTPAASASEFT